ncbi:chymotrypsin family serine protease [Plantactinospora soyae]|uniref:Peptidase S1A alpha-lytic prodomain domain-containing protein n=1 Tax=Plantactinospora soyae TaxID=1544732 RepID=A0A927M7M0_9ACTN|nr:hypothetical protein [Plantactinospora soyae]MBE1489472.1 hypothetical protein [Plantactinospora soyae]
MRRRMVFVGCLLVAVAGTTSAAQADVSTAKAAEQWSTAGFAADVDTAAMTRQYHRLRAMAAADPEGAGSTYFDEATGQLVVRYVKNEDGARWQARGRGLAAQAGDVPVRYEATDVSLRRLEEATKSLDDSRGWAGSLAGLVHQVRLDELADEIVIEAAGEAEKLAAAAERATGLPPRVTVSKAGPVQQSRRSDTAPFYGGLALWRRVVGNPLTENAACTTGFRMTRGGTNSNWVTIAGHCGTNGDQYWHPGGWAVRISSDYESLGTDVAMLAPLGDAYFSRNSWFGGRNAATAHPVSGKDTDWPAVGSALYISGSNGGLVYGRVTSDRGTCGGERMVVVDTTNGHTNDGATLGGDSGAPVTRWNTATSATDDLAAVGSHSCGNAVDTSWFVPIHRVESATDAVVVIGGN